MTPPMIFINITRTQNKCNANLKISKFKVWEYKKIAHFKNSDIPTIFQDITLQRSSAIKAVFYSVGVSLRTHLFQYVSYPNGNPSARFLPED